MTSKFFIILVSSILSCTAYPPAALGLGFGSSGLGIESLGTSLGLSGYGPELGSLGYNPFGGLDCNAQFPVFQAPPACISGCPSPLIELPTPPPPPTQVIDNKCVCTKTVVKPKLYQRLVNVPSLNRFVKKSYVPVVENIPYTTNAVSGSSCGCQGLSLESLLAANGLPLNYPPNGINLQGFPL